MKSTLVLVGAVLVAGCVTNQPLPEGYKGPTATVADSGEYEDSGRARIFAMTAIDGKQIADSFGASVNASQGKGFSLSMVITYREVPARPIKVKLRGSHLSGAPIQAIASQMAGTFLSVEGEVSFNPKANARYVVKGELKKGGSLVWIEDLDTGLPVSEKVAEK